MSEFFRRAGEINNIYGIENWFFFQVFLYLRNNAMRHRLRSLDADIDIRALIAFSGYPRAEEKKLVLGQIKILTDDGFKLMLQFFLWPVFEAHDSIVAFLKKLHYFLDMFQKHRAVSPLIVVPCEDFDEVAVHDAGEAKINDGAVRIAEDVA